MSYLLCVKCGVTQPVPEHCGKPMEVRQVDGKTKLVCWMGTKCGLNDLPEHCSVTMGIAGPESS